MPECQLNPPMVDRLQAQTRPFVPPNTVNFLNDVCRPELSLADLARMYSTTVDAISVWLSRPDVVQRLAEIRSASAQRAGFIAGMHLPHYAHSLATSLEQAVTESKFLRHLTLTLESNTLRVRYRENIRKTVALLANIARFERSAKRWSAPKSPKPTSPPSNPPRSGPPGKSPRNIDSRAQHRDTNKQQGRQRHANSAEQPADSVRPDAGSNRRAASIAPPRRVPADSSRRASRAPHHSTTTSRKGAQSSFASSSTRSINKELRGTRKAPPARSTRALHGPAP
ncbi:MAG: hypothetical protein KF691_13115 [Phycisphaeraceae bacterium]|nr:hypothetical protein [Phycisphaeraceae bacterium]